MFHGLLEHFFFSHRFQKQIILIIGVERISADRVMLSSWVLTDETDFIRGKLRLLTIVTEAAELNIFQFIP